MEVDEPTTRWYPPCPICRSKNVFISALGQLTCTYGHINTSYREEFADEFEAGSAFRSKRKLNTALDPEVAKHLKLQQSSLFLSQQHNTSKKSCYLLLQSILQSFVDSFVHIWISRPQDCERKRVEFRETVKKIWRQHVEMAEWAAKHMIFSEMFETTDSVMLAICMCGLVVCRIPFFIYDVVNCVQSLQIPYFNIANRFAEAFSHDAAVLKKRRFLLFSALPSVDFFNRIVYRKLCKILANCDLELALVCTRSKVEFFLTRTFARVKSAHRQAFDDLFITFWGLMRKLTALCPRFFFSHSEHEFTLPLASALLFYLKLNFNLDGCIFEGRSKSKTFFVAFLELYFESKLRKRDEFIESKAYLAFLRDMNSNPLCKKRNASRQSQMFAELRQRLLNDDDSGKVSRFTEGNSIVHRYATLIHIENKCYTKSYSKYDHGSRGEYHAEFRWTLSFLASHTGYSAARILKMFVLAENVFYKNSIDA